MAQSEGCGTTGTANAAVTIALAAAVGACPLAVVAQELGDFEQRGVRLGAVNVFSQLGLSTDWDDNVFAVPKDGISVGDQTVGRESDFIFVLTPQVSVESNTQRHAFFFNGEAAIGRYATFSSQDFNDWALETGGRWDVTRTFFINGAIGYDSGHESATDPDRRTLVQTTLVNILRGNVALNKRWQRSFLRFNTWATSTKYEDVEFAGVNLNEGRDVNRINNALRLGYRAGRDYDVFVELRRSQADFDNTPTRNRDQQSWGARLGTAVDIDRLVEGEFAAGIERTTFDDGETPDEIAFSFEGGLDWQLTPTTVAAVAASQSVEPSSNVNTSGSLDTEVSLLLSRSLSRRLVVSADAGYEREDFLNSNRLDQTYTAGLGAQYSVNRYLSLRAAYDFETRNSTVAVREFARNLISFSVLGRY